MILLIMKYHNRIEKQILSNSCVFLIWDLQFILNPIRKGIFHFLANFRQFFILMKSFAPEKSDCKEFKEKNKKEFKESCLLKM